MQYDLTDAHAFLERAPAVLRSLLSGLPDAWIRANEGPDTWSAFDVVGHLIHGERCDWITRARIVLEQGEARTFDRFDRFAQFEESRGKSLSDLLDEFAEVRAANLVALRELVPDRSRLDATGTHPQFGRVTLRQLLSTWVVHDLVHLQQISRVLAKQYREEIGPWLEYLSSLQEPANVQPLPGGHTIRHTLSIRALIEDVYAGFTQPERLDAWWTLASSGTPDEGATYQLGFSPDHEWQARVTRAELGRAFELELTHSDDDWLGTRVGVVLSDNGGSTRVEFHHSGWREASDHFLQSNTCWALYLRILKRHLEHGETVPYAERLNA